MKEIKNFAVIEGNAIIDSTGVTFKEIIDKQDKTKNIEKAEIRTDTSFSNGIIEYKVKFKDPDAGCLFVFKRSDSTTGLIGYSKDAKSFVIPDKSEYYRQGNLINYNLKKELQFKIEVKGSRLYLFVNNILINQGEATLAESQITFRLSGAETRLSDLKFEAIKPTVFVIMQFSQEYNELYNDVIKPVCESYNLECIRADEVFTTHPIIKDIVDSIKSSYIIIAEITPDNPNVFYEIGYAHAINKPTILLCDKKREKLPFDVSGFRTLFYENSIGGKNKVEKDLKKFIENILK